MSFYGNGFGWAEGPWYQARNQRAVGFNPCTLKYFLTSGCLKNNFFIV